MTQNSSATDSSCIITQVHVPERDAQGGLYATEKLDIVEFGIKHLRQFNQDSYIILSGHGRTPQAKYLAMCDHVIWEDVCRPLNEHGYVQGMPAQFEFVARGIQHALKQGFSHCLKTRGDCILGIPNIEKYCQQILDSENKKLLITQQTGIYQLGDCFMYGGTHLMDRIWNIDNPVVDLDGLKNTAYHFKTAVDGHGANWERLLRATCSFRDVDELQFMCLRWNYFKLNKLNEETQSQLLDPTFGFAGWHWGLTNGAHAFDSERNMTTTNPELWSAKDFYAIPGDNRC